MKQVIMYSTAVCPFCTMAKELLEERGVAPEERRLDLDPAYIAEAIEKSGGRRTVPQIFIGDDHVGGYDELKALDKAGKLASMLQDDDMG